MKYITKDNKDDLKISSINIDLANSKGLADNNGLTDKYFYIQSLYYYYLELYLNKKLNIEDLESKFTSNYRYVKDEDKDIFQYLSSNKYIYIRNTLYIEKLPINIINYLLNNNDVGILTQEIENIIESTYKEVITTNVFNHIESFETNFGPLDPMYSAENDALVLGIRFAEEDESLYESEDKWFEDYCNRRECIENLKEQINNHYSKVLNCNVKVIEYFEDSVNKMINTHVKK